MRRPANASHSDVLCLRAHDFVIVLGHSYSLHAGQRPMGRRRSRPRVVNYNRPGRSILPAPIHSPYCTSTPRSRTIARCDGGRQITGDSCALGRLQAPRLRAMGRFKGSLSSTGLEYESRDHVPADAPLPCPALPCYDFLAFDADARIWEQYRQTRGLVVGAVGSAIALIGSAAFRADRVPPGLRCGAPRCERQVA